MTKRRSAYLKYLESAHWKQLRAAVFKRDNHQCQHCGRGPGVVGHHVRYRKDLTKCTPADILSLCPQCHEDEHRRLSKLRKAKRKERSGDWLVNLILNVSASP